MIHDKGFVLPSKEQLAHVFKIADESFCSQANDDFHSTTPKIDGWERADNAVLLRLRNVEPHDDPWVSNCSSNPRVRRAIFWLLGTSNRLGQSPSNQMKLDSVWFGTGSKQIKMRAGDWVLFDDSKTHWVMSDHVWRGASWQLRKEVTARSAL